MSLAATHFAESCPGHAEYALTLSVQMSDADDRQARALMPEGPADDAATTGQEAATAAEMDSIISRNVDNASRNADNAQVSSCTTRSSTVEPESKPGILPAYMPCLDCDLSATHHWQNQPKSCLQSKQGVDLCF